MRKTLLFLYLLSLGSIAAYGQTRLTQDPKLERQLHESGLIHHPLPLDIENSFEANGWKKEVLQSAPLTRSAGTEGWSHSGAGACPSVRKRPFPAKAASNCNSPHSPGKGRPALLPTQTMPPTETAVLPIIWTAPIWRSTTASYSPSIPIATRAHRQHEPHVSQCRYSCQERI